MRIILMGLLGVLISLNCSAMERGGNLFIVSPQDTTQLYSSNNRTNLLRRFMREAAVTCFGLTDDAESLKVDTLYAVQSDDEHPDNQTRWSLICPDKECERTIKSGASEATLKKQMLLHWFASQPHQPALHKLATQLIAPSKLQALQNLKEHPIDPKLTVVAFPDAMDVDEVAQAQQDGVSVPSRKKVMVRDEEEAGSSSGLDEEGSDYFIIEPLAGVPGALSTFFDISREGVIALYIKSKLLEGNLPVLEEQKQELIQRTKKQRLVQEGYPEKSLVCPEDECMYIQTDRGPQRQALEKVTNAMLVHYLMEHKKESPMCVSVAALVAPSFAEARDKMLEGERNE